MKPAVRTAVAAILSLAVHGGAVAALLVTREESVDIAGGATAVALIGDSTVDAISAGNDLPTVEPVDPSESDDTLEPVTETAVPVDTKPVETALLQPMEPVQAQQVAPVPVETPAPEPVPVPVAEPTAEPVEAPASSPVQAVESATAAEIQATETVAELEEVPIPAARPVQPVEATEPVRMAAVDPTPKVERVEPLKPTARESAPKKPQREQARKKPAPQQSGNGGRSEADARKGNASGREQGEQAEAGERSGKASREGNAAVSNYPGKVVSKLRRALRYPAEARRQRIRGEVHVAFTVAAGGGISGVRIVRSSGSPVLDKAAIETVQRAAPFPPIPDSAGRKSWPFTVPLAFTR